ncbi:GMP synthase (glutamine-hydrolysing) [Rhizobiales bacterium GAS188]|nr:GMP synthase (glutamine-hydrolysing) [Rhizobiales bacterium GAS188]
MSGKTTGKLLYLANGPKKVSVARLDERFAGYGFEVEIRSAYDGDFPDDLEDYAGIFLSGSPHAAFDDIPFIHREHALIRDAAAQSIPMLGLCFGSQILGSALCGRDQVFRRDSCEVGYKWLATHAAAAADPVAKDILPRVYMFIWHNDEVRAAHEDLRILASSDECPNQIWRYRDRPIWGIQGHPEINRTQSRIWFEENRARLEKDGAVIDELNRTADDAEQAKTLLGNFAAFCLA